jgi:hypothetical protein
MTMLVVLGEISRWTGMLSFIPPVEFEWAKACAIFPVSSV